VRYSRAAREPLGSRDGYKRGVATIHVTGHRNPDLDSIGSAIGYAELHGRLDGEHEYVPARLGEVNSQTEWALARAGAREPELLPHVKLRVRDVMSGCPVTVSAEDPVRGVGLAMAEHGLDVVPVLDADGTLAGVLTERVLARLYIRESQDASDFGRRPVELGAVRDVLGGEVLVTGDGDVSGRLWVVSMDAAALAGMIGEGDIAIVGNLREAQLVAVERGVDLLVLSNGVRPGDDVLEAARARHVNVIVSPLDSYVSARMIQLAVPVGRIMDAEPLTVDPDDVLEDVTPDILEVDYRAAVVVDERRRALGIVGRSDLVGPEPRKVVLVDHAESSQSVPGVERAEIVEILDHHHIGSIETHVPVRATFDPVGSTATLVAERFGAEGVEPSRAAAFMLLAALLSDTVALTSPTTTERDRRVAERLGALLGVEAEALGMEMFRASSDVSRLSAEEIAARDAKSYALAGDRTALIAQVEVVGDELLARAAELRAALDRAREAGGHALAALMVTDIAAGGTTLLVSGDVAALERAFGQAAGEDGALSLPGVMSRKKQVAPKILGV
jgi:manganese-dependent inorganic pyrophosphatase